MSESNRMHASISFVAILIVVGIPLWWKTTEVYRVSLPYNRLSKFENISVKITMDIEIACHNIQDAVKKQNELLNTLHVDDIYIIRFKPVVLPNMLKNFSDVITSMEKKGSGNLLLVEWPKLNNDIHITLSRTIFYSPQSTTLQLAKVIEEQLLTTEKLRLTIKTLSTMTTVSDNAGRKRIRPSKAFDISLSIVVPDPDKIKVEWIPKDALEEYITPFINELGVIYNFTLKSQWLYFTHLEFTSKQIQDNSEMKRHFSLPENVLPHLITPLEKKLASHISTNPCLNFVLYIPSCEQSPIRIYSQKGTLLNNTMDAFLSSRWGGVVIGNPPSEICAPYLYLDDPNIPTFEPPTKQIMGYFLSQLRSLLGLEEKESVQGVYIENLKTVSLRKWELDILMRIYTIEQVLSAKLTLHSLMRLLGEISNIVINNEVGAAIYNAVENVELTIYHLDNGHLKEALESSKQAFLSAEAAFTDPSLLALLYFPDEQKYAVYIPLFLPIMIPVVISLKNIWKKFKENNAKEKEE